MTDLIARLEELEKQATPGPWKYRHRQSDWYVELGAGDWHDEWCRRRLAEMIDPEQGWHDAALVSELRNNLPAILHALKVQQAAEDACQEMTWAEFIGKKWPALVRAVKGEQP